MTQHVFTQHLSIGSGDLKVAVKDSIDVAGFPTCLGSKALAFASPATSHAEVVQRVIDANCELVGKLNMHELAFGMSGVNSWTGTPINAKYPDYIPGGSSSGSAVAVADKLVDFALGTDTGGSIRVPAACCGVYGLKPTFGRVSRAGVTPQNSTLDCVGPMAGSAEGLKTAMQIITADYSAVEMPENISLGVVKADYDDEVGSVFAANLQQVQLEQHEINLPSFKQAFDAGLSLINAETCAAFKSELAEGNIGPDVSQRLRKACLTNEAEIAEALQIKARFSQEVNLALNTVTALVLPTLPSLPMTREKALQGNVDLNISALVRPFNLTGHPALTIPLLSSQNYPVGLQLVAAHGEDELLCELAITISKFLN